MSQRINVATTSCCGLRIIRGLNTDIDCEKAMMKICREMYIEDIDCAFMVFSGEGDTFTKYIKQYKLGKVIESRIEDAEHPGRLIKTWIWEVSRRFTISWFNKQTNNKYKQEIKEHYEMEGLI
jgi:hypothetical protein